MKRKLFALILGVVLFITILPEMSESAKAATVPYVLVYVSNTGSNTTTYVETYSSGGTSFTIKSLAQIKSASSNTASWTKSGYVFKGWGTAYNSTTVKYASGTKTTFNQASPNSKTLTLYAIWEKQCSHTRAAWKLTKPASCMSGGVESYICQGCGTILTTRSTASLGGHRYMIYDGTSVTVKCTRTGCSAQLNNCSLDSFFLYYKGAQKAENTYFFASDKTEYYKVLTLWYRYCKFTDDDTTKIISTIKEAIKNGKSYGASTFRLSSANEAARLVQCMMNLAMKDKFSYRKALAGQIDVTFASCIADYGSGYVTTSDAIKILAGIDKKYNNNKFNSVLGINSATAFGALYGLTVGKIKEVNQVFMADRESESIYELVANYDEYEKFFHYPGEDTEGHKQFDTLVANKLSNEYKRVFGVNMKDITASKSKWYVNLALYYLNK